MDPISVKEEKRKLGLCSNQNNDLGLMNNFIFPLGIPWKWSTQNCNPIKNAAPPGASHSRQGAPPIALNTEWSTRPRRL